MSQSELARLRNFVILTVSDEPYADNYKNCQNDACALKSACCGFCAAGARRYWPKPADCIVPRTHISSIERGERNISLDNIEKLAFGVGIPITELFDRNSKQNGR